MGADGALTQHGDLATDILWHASQHNGASFGVEVVNPYYPSYLKPGLPWQRVIKAPWAHKGAYVLPTPAQAEAVASLARWATSAPASGIGSPSRRQPSSMRCMCLGHSGASVPWKRMVSNRPSP